MTPIFPQMRCDPINARLNRHQRSANRVRIIAPTGVSNGCHMVNVQTEA
jgi:hypothetical protein